MRLWRLRNDKELLLRNQQRVEAPRSDKELAAIIGVDPVVVRRCKLNVGARGAKELLSDGRAEGVGRDAHNPNENPVGERRRDGPGQPSPPPPSQHERRSRVRRCGKNALKVVTTTEAYQEVLRSMAYDQHVVVVDPKT
jgi:hypothetical protein